MKRLNQLVTRLLIIALVALAVWVGRMHLGKQVLAWHLESRIGARADIKQMHFNDNEAMLLLSQVEIANPRRRAHNLLQFEAASVKLNMEALKERRFVIEEGRLSQIRFAAPRTDSGEIQRSIFNPNAPLIESSSETALPAGAPRLSEEFVAYPPAQRWLDSLVVNVKQGANEKVEPFQLSSLLRQKTQQWVDRFTGPGNQMAQIESSLAFVEETLAVPVDRLNPLRSGKRLDEAVKAIASTEASLEKVGVEIADFESISQKDIYELSQVHMRDRQLLVTRTGGQKFDSNLINEILVGKIERQLVADGLAWFQQFRNSLPNPETDFSPSTRGKDMLFGKLPQKSTFEIRKLQIDGATEFANSHFKFAGTVENICDVPVVGSKPVKFDFRAQGEPQVVVSGTLDRTSGRNVDSIKFTGHSIPQPSYILGNEDSIKISMSGDSQLHVDANLSVDTDHQLSGTITFTFEDVMFHADSVHEVAGGAETAARLNETVSGINTFQITSTLGGTIFQPTTSFASDLGPKVASSLETVFGDAQQLANKKRENLLNRAVNNDFDSLKKNLTKRIAQLNNSWRSNYVRLKELKKKMNPEGSTRMSRPDGFSRF